MKRLFLLFAVCFGLVFSVAAQSQILYSNTPTFLWDAVTTDVNGDPFLPEDVVSYNVYIWDSANGNIAAQPISALTFLSNTASTQLQLSFPYRANWVVAVAAKLITGASVETVGPIAYSTEAIPTTAIGPFVYVPQTLIVPKLRGLRDSGM